MSAKTLLAKCPNPMGYVVSRLNRTYSCKLLCDKALKPSSVFLYRRDSVLTLFSLCFFLAVSSHPHTMQRATCTSIRIRSPSDARVIFHAVLLNILPMVTRRLDNEERGLISPGSVYVWEERGPHAELTGVRSCLYFLSKDLCLTIILIGRY